MFPPNNGYYILDTRCPSSVEIFEKTPYFRVKNLILGSYGDDAKFIFPEYVSNLPKCQQVIMYEIKNISPPGFAALASTCTSILCNEVDIDTSKE